MKNILLTLLVFQCFLFSLKAQIITTVAGSGTQGYSGDGGPAINADLFNPSGVAWGGSGNLFFADEGNSVIRKVDNSGTITSFAGCGYSGYSGDGGPATTAELDIPEGIAFDKFGNLYIADTYNSVVRKVNLAGTISTIIGNGTYGYAGDGGPGSAAELSWLTGVAVDAAGNIFIADNDNQVIRKVNTSGIITTIAGNSIASYSGDGGLATNASLNKPWGVTNDNAGNIYIADAANNRIRKVNTAGIISTVVGNGVLGYSGDGGQATIAEFAGANSLYCDGSGNLYVPDNGNNRIRKVNTSGIITTVVGNGFNAYSGDGGPATAAELNTPTCVTSDGTGNIYIADYYNNRVRKVTHIVGIDEISEIKESVKLFSNPNNGRFTISLSHAVPMAIGIVSASHPKVEIYNVLGEKVFDATLNYNHEYNVNQNGMSNQVQGDNSIDISNQPAGIYFYRLINEMGNAIAEGKFVIEK